MKKKYLKLIFDKVVEYGSVLMKLLILLSSEKKSLWYNFFKGFY